MLPLFSIFYYNYIMMIYNINGVPMSTINECDPIA